MFHPGLSIYDRKICTYDGKTDITLYADEKKMNIIRHRYARNDILASKVKS